jgi:aldehyde dehydrogenase (NAD+)
MSAVDEKVDPIDKTPPVVHLHIGGERLTTGSGGYHDRINPSTGQVDARVPLAGADEVDRAVRVAHEAFQTWRRTSGAERRRLLLRLADLIEANAAEFTRRNALDNGMPYHQPPELSVGVTLEWIRYYAGWADKLSSDVVGSFREDGEFSYTVAQPYGVIGVIITWNGPLGSYGMKLPPALAAGNTVVVKPSELVPFSGELLADLVEQAGFPPGVINILPGSPDAGQALVEHPLVQKISFTGGPATGKKILATCAESFTPVVLELGGKSANLVFEDADLDAAAAHGAIMSVGVLAGQGCVFPTRMLVQRSVYEDMVAKVKAIAESFEVGDPFDPQTLSGPLINSAAVERVLGMITRAKEDGARLVTGGARLGGELADGYFMAPTVFADVDPNSELGQNEVFGPVLAMIPFDTEEEAIQIANGTPYTLGAYIQTRDVARAHRVAEELAAGEISINGASIVVHANSPFGGFGGVSGVGKEGGRQGIEEFLKVKRVGVAP